MLFRSWSGGDCTPLTSTRSQNKPAHAHHLPAPAVSSQATSGDGVQLVSRISGQALMRCHVDDARSCAGKGGRANQNLHFVHSGIKQIGQGSALRLLESHKGKKPFSIKVIEGLPWRSSG